MRRSKLYIFIAFMAFLSGCYTVYAPAGKLAESPEEFVKSGKGGWLSIRLKPPHPQAMSMQGGEFLFQDSVNVYLLNKTVNQYPKSMIDLAVLELMKKRPYAWWWILGSASTISHGFGLIATFPLWQIVGISATYGELWHDVYKQEKPDDSYWQGINVLARFPGGLDADQKLKISQ
ncbi:MAG: hypothetical protein L6Q47_11200 [Ignavibacteriaceae bacterium]|nr:hypothetical protein [Ignavibacteriaceae bacterium]